jgi:hypothetical protein
LPELPKLVIAGIGKRMMAGIYSTEHREEASRVPEARYSYYRRCQVFRRNGEQCKAPAEKGASICHAHAAQQAMAFRRDLEQRIVLAEAVAEMRRRGRPQCQMADLLTDFKGIQVTLAVVARALIAGRIDCKTAGRLLVHLQTMSKLLWMLEKTKTLPQVNTDNTDVKELMGENATANEREKTGIVLVAPRVSAENAQLKPRAEKGWAANAGIGCDDHRAGTQFPRLEVTAFPDPIWAHGPPESKAA